MARIFMTGFEAGSTGVYSVTNAGVTTTEKRTGSYAVALDRGPYGVITLASPVSELFIRIGLWPNGGYSSYRNHTFMELFDSGGARHLTFCLNSSTLAFEVRRGSYDGPVLATGLVPTAQSWGCLEIHVVIHDSAGILQTKWNGVLDIDASGLNTRDGGNGDIVGIRIGSSSVNINSSAYGYYDDVAVNDTSGTINNSWPGRGGIHALVPNGAGTLTQLTPSAGSNYECVDERTPDDDTSYVESAVLDTSDLYATAGVTPTDGTVSAVQWLARAKLTDSGEGNLRRLVRHDGSNYAGDDQGLDTSYRYLSEIMEKAPDETEWTLSKVNALEIGQQVG